MKIDFLIKTILYFIFFGGIFSCKKIDCPVPASSNKATVKSNNIDSAKTEVKRYVVLLQPGNEGKDAVLSNIYSDQNFSASTYLHARAWTVNGELSLEKSIIQFDYSSIPANANISKAILILYADTTLNTGSLGHSQLGSNDWVLKRVIQPWNEATVTWNNQPKIDLTSEIQCLASTSPSQSYVLDRDPPHNRWVARSRGGCADRVPPPPSRPPGHKAGCRCAGPVRS